MEIKSTEHDIIKKMPYPYIGIHQFNWEKYSTKVLVIFTEQRTGFCVQDERNDNDTFNRFMSFRQDWCEEDFIPYNGNINLSN